MEDPEERTEEEEGDGAQVGVGRTLATSTRRWKSQVVVVVVDGIGRKPLTLFCNSGESMSAVGRMGCFWPGVSRC